MAALTVRNIPDEAIAGLRVKRFHPTTTPETIDAEIAALL